MAVCCELGAACTNESTVMTIWNGDENGPVEYHACPYHFEQEDKRKHKWYMGFRELTEEEKDKDFEPVLCDECKEMATHMVTKTYHYPGEKHKASFTGVFVCEKHIQNGIDALETTEGVLEVESFEEMEEDYRKRWYEE